MPKKPLFISTTLPTLSKLLVFSLLLLGGGCAEPGDTITFWVMPNADPEGHGRWLERKREEFLKTAGIKVNYEVIRWVDSWEKIRKALAAGGGPDVLQLPSTWNAFFADQGGLMTLDWREFGGEESFVPVLRESCVYRGACAGVPWFCETAVLFCNDDLLEKNGVAPPRTIKELYSLGRKIARGAGKGAALSLPGLNAEDLVHYWSIFFYGGGGRYLSTDLKTTLLDGPAAVEAVRLYLDFFREGLSLKARAEYTSAQSEDLFFKGRTAMCFLYPRGARQLIETSARIKASAVVPPSGADGTDTFVHGSNLTIPKASAHRVKATRWINFLLQEDTLTDYTHDLCAVIPAKRSVLESAAFSRGDWPIFKAALSRSRSYPVHPVWLNLESETSRALKLILVAYLSGKYKPEIVPAVMGKAADAVNKALAGK